MKKFKELKKVTALVLCGILCLGNVTTAMAATGVPAASKELVIYDDNDIKMAYSFVVREGGYFSGVTRVERDYADRNKYNAKMYMRPMVRDDDTGVYTRYEHQQFKYAGYTGNLVLGETYYGCTIMFIDTTITVGDKYRSFTY